MAFVARSKKETLANLVSTTSHVGPGTYNPKAATAPTRISYAPFASSAERGGPDTAAFTPGPGEYVRDVLAPVTQASVSGSHFLSRVERFPFALNHVPGPGAYNSKGTFRAPKPLPTQPGGAAAAPGSKPPASSGVQWVRINAPPSIPTSGQSYGYEENSAGDLVMQRAPRQGYSGAAGDVPGPGVYNPNADVLGRRADVVLADFAKPSGSRYSHLPSKSQLTVPGPGLYNPSEPRRRGAKKPSASFISTVKRWGKHKKTTITPGPGYYHADQPVVKPQTADDPRAAAGVAFGTTAGRELTTAPAGLVANPGPGAYSAPYGFHGRPVMDGPDVGARIAFHSTADRFVSPQHGAAPGPGFYAQVHDVSADLAKKRFGRNASFGATTARFWDQKAGVSGVGDASSGAAATAAAQPGPGSYDTSRLLQDVQRAKDARRPAAVFASHAPRFRDETKTAGGGSGLGPGHYDAPVPMGLTTDPAARVRPSPAFRATTATSGPAAAGRDPIPARQSLETAHLGPGRYAVEQHNRLGAGTGKAVSSAFRDTSARFGEGNAVYAKRGTAVPGPGYYSAPNHRADSMIKRSYNITVAHS